MNHIRLATRTAACALVLAACAPNSASVDGPRARAAPTLSTFGSDEAFARYQQRMARELEERTRNRPTYGSYPATPKPPPLGSPVPRGEPVEAAAPGVHEAGIVKAMGDYLVVLRRNRLHTLRIADGGLDTVASVDAFAPGTEAELQPVRGMLAGNGVVAVLGWHGMVLQVALFRLDAAGGLAYQGTYMIPRESGQEYEPIVRMVDGKLVVLATIPVWAGNPDGPAQYLPVVVRREPGSAAPAWTPLVQPAAIYRPAADMRADDGVAFHTLTVCDPAGGALECRATVVYAPRKVAQHLSRTAAYVWAKQRPESAEETRELGILYRIPLDGGAPTALRVDGRPSGEHAFDETEDGELHVLLSGGRLPVNRQPAEYNSVVLLRVALAAFGDGSATAGDDAYGGRFPNPGSTTLLSRFAGDWIVYGTMTESGAYGTWEEGRVYAVRRDGAGAPVPVPLSGRLIAIDTMGGGALVTTAINGIRHLPLRLGSEVSFGEPFTRDSIEAWEEEAHSLFPHPVEDGTGVLGVARSGFAYTPSVLFLRHDGSGLREMGLLGITAPPGWECSQCGVYYDFARPLFIRGRTFALIGGEMVEAVVEGGRIREVRRVRFGPPAIVEP